MHIADNGKQFYCRSINKLADAIGYSISSITSAAKIHSSLAGYRIRKVHTLYILEGDDGMHAYQDLEKLIEENHEEVRKGTRIEVHVEWKQ